MAQKFVFELRVDFKLVWATLQYIHNNNGFIDFFLGNTTNRANKSEPINDLAIDFSFNLFALRVFLIWIFVILKIYWCIHIESLYFSHFESYNKMTNMAIKVEDFYDDFYVPRMYQEFYVPRILEPIINKLFKICLLKNKIEKSSLVV